jgi:hypothetical protein
MVEAARRESGRDLRDARTAAELDDTPMAYRRGTDFLMGE